MSNFINIPKSLAHMYQEYHLLNQDTYFREESAVGKGKFDNFSFLKSSNVYLIEHFTVTKKPVRSLPYKYSLMAKLPTLAEDCFIDGS